ncbi:MAG: hypothetical protein ACREN6_16300 [Gemmatimonadaceae bacterium]
MEQPSHHAALRVPESERPVVRAAVIGLAFIGLWWLTEPIFARVGLGTVEASRPHLLFVGACVAAALAVVTHRRRTSGAASIGEEPKP